MSSLFEYFVKSAYTIGRQGLYKRADALPTPGPGGQYTPGPAATVDPNSMLGWFRNNMLGYVRENASDYNDPLAQAYSQLRQYGTDAELQQALRQGYQAQLNGRMAGTTAYLNDPYYRLFKYFQGATSLDNAGMDKSRWGEKMQRGALDSFCF